MAKEQPIVTRESLHQMITEANSVKRYHIVGRALVVLLNRQTREEQRAERTEVTNGVGFSSVDAEFGTICAKAYQEHRLSTRMVDYWLRTGKSGFYKICKYHKQLNDEAVAKRNSQ